MGVLPVFAEQWIRGIYMVVFGTVARGPW